MFSVWVAWRILLDAPQKSWVLKRKTPQDPTHSPYKLSSVGLTHTSSSSMMMMEDTDRLKSPKIVSAKPGHTDSTANTLTTPNGVPSGPWHNLGVVNNPKPDCTQGYEDKAMFNREIFKVLFSKKYTK